MSLDLNSLLSDWPHEPGAIKVRKIIGLDGREKLQLRIDLGVLQMEIAGRPDGQRPHNCESLLVYHQRRAERAEARGETYELSAEQCRPVCDPLTLESNVPGIYVAGVIVAGSKTNEIFIENGRFHGRQIAEDLKQKLGNG